MGKICLPPFSLSLGIKGRIIKLLKPTSLTCDHAGRHRRHFSAISFTQMKEENRPIAY